MSRFATYLPGVLALTAFLGFLDASFLLANHMLKTTPPCTLAGGGCDIVTTSTYSSILGIPVSFLGLVFYLSVLILIGLCINKKFIWGQLALVSLTSVGFLFSLWFFYVQWQILKTWCPYCLFSGLTSTLLWVFSLMWYKYQKTTLSLST